MTHKAPDIQGVKLTHNQSLVLGILKESKTPHSAYTLLDKLRGDGFRAPLQIYRALDKLITLGLVHRLESLNAFIACNHNHTDHCGTMKEGCGHDRGEGIVFAICQNCHKVVEIADPALNTHLEQVARHADFILSHSMIEMRGLCQSCEASPIPDDTPVFPLS